MPDPTIDAARRILGDSLDELRTAIDGRSAEQLNRRPAGEDSNGLGVIATHAVHSTRAWLSLATGAPLPARDRPAEFTVVVEEPTSFLAVFDGLAAECRGLLGADTSIDPGRESTAPWRSGSLADEPVTAAWALIFALAHLREHVGHAQLTRQVV